VSRRRAKAILSFRNALVLILGLGLAGCGLLRSQGPSINLTMTAGLEDTQAIEILALPEPGQQAQKPEQVVAVITEPKDIHRIVEALDSSLQLVPRALCLERYRLRFQRPEGEAVTFGYSCDAGGVFLRGDQSFWRGMEVVPPEDFQELIGGYLRD